MGYNTTKELLERPGTLPDTRPAATKDTIHAQMYHWVAAAPAGTPAVDDSYQLQPGTRAIHVDVTALGSTENCNLLLPMVGHTQFQLLYIYVEGLGAGETCTVTSADEVDNAGDLDYAGFGYWGPLVLTPGTDLTGDDGGTPPHKFSMVLCYNTGFGWLIVTSCYPWGWPQP